MKKIIIVLLYMSITIIFLTGCGATEKILNPLDSKITGIPTTPIKENEENVDENLEPTISTTSNPTIIPYASLSEEALAIEAYKSVLQNKSTFYDTFNKKDIYLKDFLGYEGAGFDAELGCSYFSILDMDGDEISEVVLDLSFYGREGSDFSEVLHYMNGSITGYLLSQKDLEELKNDGTFIYSWGAGDWGCAKLKFKSDDYESVRLGYIESSDNGVTYFINNKPGTEDLFETIINEQNDKKDTVWYKFSEENINIKLSEG